MFKKNLISFVSIVFSFLTLDLIAQPHEIDSARVIRESKNLISKYNQLLFDLSSDIPFNSKMELINNNANLQNPYRIFQNDSVRIDDDINPNKYSVATKYPDPNTIKIYLDKYRQRYRPDKQTTTEFHILQTGKACQTNDSLFLKIIFRSKFYGKNKYEDTVKYRESNRIAVIRGVRLHQWNLYISSILFCELSDTNNNNIYDVLEYNCKDEYAKLPITNHIVVKDKAPTPAYQPTSKVNIKPEKNEEKEKNVPNYKRSRYKPQILIGANYSFTNTAIAPQFHNRLGLSYYVGQIGGFFVSNIATINEHPDDDYQIISGHDFQSNPEALKVYLESTGKKVDQLSLVSIKEKYVTCNVGFYLHLYKEVHFLIGTAFFKGNTWDIYQSYSYSNQPTEYYALQNDIVSVKLITGLAFVYPYFQLESGYNFLVKKIFFNAGINIPIRK